MGRSKLEVCKIPRDAHRQRGFEDEFLRFGVKYQVQGSYLKVDGTPLLICSSVTSISGVAEGARPSFRAAGLKHLKTLVQLNTLQPVGTQPVTHPIRGLKE